jgi:hypothetical protein
MGSERTGEREDGVVVRLHGHDEVSTRARVYNIVKMEGGVKGGAY